MTFFSRLSIRRKVTLAILLGSVTTVGVGGLALIVYEIGTYKQQALRTVSVLARVAAANSTGALAFGDAATAEHVLAALGDDPSIVSARLYLANGAPLASYQDPHYKSTLPDRAPPDGVTFGDNRLVLSRPILLNVDRVGQLYLEFDLDRARAHLWAYVGIVGLAMAALFAIALFVSWGLERFVSAPIQDLAAVARHITENKDFSVRARGGGEDEIGALTEAFNLMLQAIQTRETELDQSRANMELAQRAGKIGAFVWYARTDRVDWSDEMYALHGTDRNRFPGTRNAWLQMIYPEDIARVNELTRAGQRRGDLEMEYRIRWPDGSIRWIVSRTKFYFTPDGALERGVGVNIDITERKHFEAQLVEQAEALWRSNRELEQFAYVSSHDLQEPLRKVASYAELLANKYRGQMGEEADRYIENVTDGVGRMRDLIHDLLAFSRLSRQDVPLEAVDIDGVVRRILSDLELSIREKSAEVKIVSALPSVHARRSQMQQLFQNLITNALKFQPEGTAPRVEIGHQRQDGEDVFFVRDNGIGLEEKYTEQIFKVFQRLHPRGKYPGTGIGLAICKKIVEQHGGRIWLKSELGKGSTFFFSIPLVEAAVAGGGAPPEGAENA